MPELKKLDPDALDGALEALRAARNARGDADLRRAALESLTPWTRSRPSRTPWTLR